MENLRILVPLDFSDLSARALHSAEKMARLFNGSITPFHSYVPMNEMDSPYIIGIGASQTEDFERMESTLTERLREISENEVSGDYLRKPLISIGNAAQTIIEEAKDFDMIVMSTHGRTGFTRLFLGSISEKVLRLSHVPVLVVNKERELRDINRIMITTDFSDRSLAAFPYAREIAENAGATLNLIHIMSYDPNHEDQPDESVINLRNQRLSILAKEELHEVSDLLETNVIVSADTPHEAILNYNLNNPHDLIVMSTVGRSGIEYLMMGSTTANVVRHVKSPVLSINPKQKKPSPGEKE